MITLFARAFCSFLVLAVVARESAATGAASAALFIAGGSTAAGIDVETELSTPEICAPTNLSADDTYRRTFRVTAYCDRGITASGIPSGAGQCAAPTDIPFGARIFVPELGQTFVVTDRTHRRFRHNTIDIFMPVRSDCLKFGRSYIECEVSLPETPVKYASPTLASLISARNH